MNRMAAKVFRAYCNSRHPAPACRDEHATGSRAAKRGFWRSGLFWQHAGYHDQAITDAEAECLWWVDTWRSRGLTESLKPTVNRAWRVLADV